MNAKTGQHGRLHVNESILQNVFRQVIVKAGLTKRATFQTLWYSFAAFLIEAGYDIRNTQKLLWQECASTTLVYAHALSRDGQSVVSYAC